MMAIGLSVILKLLAATLSGTTLLLSWRKLRRDDALFRLRHDVVRRSNSAASEPAPSILVVGFRSHGKSAFVNTACRVIAREDGPMVLRTETAPAGLPAGSAVTRVDRVVQVVARGHGDESGEEMTVMEMVDTPGLSGDGDVRAEVDSMVRQRKAVAVECVVIVMRCPGIDNVPRKAAVRKLEEITTAVRDHGLLVVIVLTHKRSMKGSKHCNELRDEVAVAARTDCVYLVDNYTAGPAATGIRYPQTVRNVFDTHFNVLAIIRQSIEFAFIHRAQLKHKPSSKEPTKAP